ncbi:MAG: O-antigen polymerase [Halothiobacillaceae bacterium]|nr:MAG: O-antigen polymerase [Halothiobacillaceae bacterium]
MNASPTHPLPGHYLFGALLTLLVLIPLPHGGELAWEQLPFISASFLLLTLWCWQQWHNNRPPPAILHTLRTPLIIFAAWLLYIALQTVPLPMVLLETVSPTANALKQAVPLAAATSLSVDPASTLLELLRYTSYLTLFFLLLVLCNSVKRLKLVALTLFLVGLLQALYSLLNYYTHGVFSLNEPIPPWGTPWSDATRGTYTHRNHFAALMEMTIPMGMALIIVASTKAYSGVDHWQHRLNRLLEFMMSVRMLYSFCIVLMLTALIFTSSRGGNAAFAGAFFITSLSFLLLRGSQSHTVKLVPAVIILTMIIAALFGTGKLTDRLEKEGLGPNGRDYMRTGIVNLIRDYPLFGSGAGTYPQLFAAYKLPDLGVSAMSKRAHNDYLELISDQGVIGFGLLGGGMILLLSNIWVGIGRRRDPTMTGLLYGSCLGITSMLIHAFVEFNFHIPANATYFFVLLAIGVIAANLRTDRT